MQLQEVKAINGVLHYESNGQWFPIRIVGNFGGGRRSSSSSGGGIGGGGTLFQLAMFTPDGTHIGDTTITFLPEINPGEGNRYLYNANTPLHGSNTGIQYSATRANRAQIRLNAYGNHGGDEGVGMTSFKSRGATIGSLASVLVGDSIYRITAIGVTGNNSGIPLSGTIDCLVTTVAPTYLGTDWVFANVSKNGPQNGKRNVFRVDSESVIHLLEKTTFIFNGSPVTQDGCAGVAILDGGGNFLVLNANVTATSRITLTIQDGGAVPTTSVYVSTRVPGTSFTISSIGGGNFGVNVYWQIFEPQP